jgi:exodeoxyribonuclease VII large subunit
MTNDDIITVSNLTRYIKNKFTSDEELNHLKLKGELSNYKAYPSGHHYFTLKDEKSQIQAVMFRNSAKALNFKPKNGMNVVVSGKVDVYEVQGKYQFYVSKMAEEGIGNLYLKYEELKNRLKLEGLFQKPKKVIPRFPKKIGVITAETGAVIRDIITTVNRRWPYTEIILWPSLVQGEGAKEAITKNIHLANQSDIDVLIIGRGGGSIEDLWAFNEEMVVRAISDSKVPIISAVGHETDTTLSDYVADLRAPTPTSAAEQAVPNVIEIRNNLNNKKIRLNQYMDNTIRLLKENINKIKEKSVLKDPMIFYESKIETLGHLEEKIIYFIKDIIEKNRLHIEQIKEKIQKRLENQISENETKINLLTNKIIILNPLNTVERGYSIIKLKEKVISSVKDIKINDNIEIELKDGFIESEVKKVNENK